MEADIGMSYYLCPPCSVFSAPLGYQSNRVNDAGPSMQTDQSCTSRILQNAFDQ